MKDKKNNEDRETNTIKMWIFVYVQREGYIFKFINTKSMFLLNTAAFLKIVFKDNRWFFDFIFKVWTNLCTIRIKMFDNDVYICNSFHLMYDFFREIWLCTSNFSYDVFDTFQVFLRYFLWIKIYREILKSALVYL